MIAPLRYRTILFDLDGTLIDSIELILASHRHATREVLGASPPDDVLREGIGTPLLTQMRTLRRAARRRARDAYRAFNHRMHDELLRPYDGLLELCDAAARARAPRSASSRRSRCSSTEMAFARLAFAPLLDVVVTVGSDRAPQAAAGADPRGAPAARPRRLRRLLRRRLAVRPAGRRARRASTPIGVTWGAFDRGRAARRATRRDRPHARRARRDPAWHALAEPGRARRLAAARARAAPPAVPRRGRARDRRRRVRRALPRARRRSRRQRPRAAHARLADPARRRHRAGGLRGGAPPPADALARERARRRRAARLGRARPPPARGGADATSHRATSPSRRSTGSRSRSSTATACSSAARRAATGSSARTSRPTCARCAPCRCGSSSRTARRRRRSSRCAARSTCRSPPSRGSTRSAPRRASRRS